MNKLLKSTVAVILGGLLSSCVCHTPTNDTRAMLGQTQAKEGAEGIAMNNVYFAFDKYDLSETSKNTLRRNAAWLRTNSDLEVQIEGHADERGTNRYNMVLAKNRAMASANFLKSVGIDGKRMTTISFGEERPVDPSHNENAWAKNRRVEFKALGSEAQTIRTQ